MSIFAGLRFFRAKVLCYGMLWYAMLCYAMLCYAMLCFIRSQLTEKSAILNMRDNHCIYCLGHHHHLVNRLVAKCHFLWSGLPIMALFDEISSVHEHKLNQASVHLVSVLHF